MQRITSEMNLWVIDEDTCCNCAIPGRACQVCRQVGDASSSSDCTTTLSTAAALNSPSNDMNQEILCLASVFMFFLLFLLPLKCVNFCSRAGFLSLPLPLLPLPALAVHCPPGMGRAVRQDKGSKGKIGMARQG